MTRVAIVGSRNFGNAGLVAAVVQSLANKIGIENLIIVSGGAKGVDTWAEIAAIDLGVATRIYKADWDKYGKGAGFLRNTDIITNSDYVIAFWDELSRGTADSIQKAKSLGKKVVVLNKHGIEITEYNNEDKTAIR